MHLHPSLTQYPPPPPFASSILVALFQFDFHVLGLPFSFCYFLHFWFSLFGWVPVCLFSSELTFHGIVGVDGALGIQDHRLRVTVGKPFVLRRTDWGFLVGRRMSYSFHHRFHLRVSRLQLPTRRYRWIDRLYWCHRGN